MNNTTRRKLLLIAAVLLTITSLITIFSIVTGQQALKWYNFITFIVAIFLWVEYIRKK